MKLQDLINEASPDTLAGSFTDDLNASKQWLADTLKRYLRDKTAGDIYVLGSWYGNIATFLEQAKIKYDRIIMVEIRKAPLRASRKLLQPIEHQGKLKLVLKDAADIEYPNKHITVINTSINDMNQDWLSKVPNGTLTVVQGRNNLSDPKTATDNMAKFEETFPLEKLIYQGKRQLEDPETKYTRFMKIGIK